MVEAAVEEALALCGLPEDLKQMQRERMSGVREGLEEEGRAGRGGGVGNGETVGSVVRLLCAYRWRRVMWEAAEAGDGRVYFFHTVSRQTAWRHPDGDDDAGRSVQRLEEVSALLAKLESLLLTHAHATAPRAGGGGGRGGDNGCGGRCAEAVDGFTAFMHVCVSEGAYRAAVGTVARMQRRAVTPDAQCLDVLARALSGWILQSQRSRTEQSQHETVPTASTQRSQPPTEAAVREAGARLDQVLWRAYMLC
jgi:hypothetical protein